MVRIEEVPDESQKFKQADLHADPADDERDWEATDDDTDEDDVSDDEDLVYERGLVVPRESLWDRFAALKDILSPSTRTTLARTWHKTCTYSVFGGWVAGKLIWIGVTSALLVGLPFALAVEDESRLTAQEKELMGQQNPQQMLPPGTDAAQNAQPNMVPGGQPQGLRPPGF
ncbi:mitochondrial import receptor subunit Tom22 [Malassezia sp. CBS 17886]|nr:mitochondrial import receptor subunit Tom22 [Malassezia sp. CBS 17886]